MAEEQPPSPAPTSRPAAGFNPFARPGGAFFAHGDRQAYLEQLREPLQWPRALLLVTGSRGAGKTMLYRQLSASLDPRVQAARVNAALIHDGREVLDAVAQGFGLAAPADATADRLGQLIAEHAAAQQRSGGLCVTLVDDAELLEPRALEYLLTLVDDSPMRLVLFGETRLVPAVARGAAALELDWQELRLTGLSPDAVRSYLGWRFEQAGYGDVMPFTTTQVANIAQLSEGLPGRIDQMANVLLAQIESGQAGRGAAAAEPRGRLSALRLPPMHRAALALLAVVVVLIYALWEPGSEREPLTAVRSERLELPPPANAVRPASRTAAPAQTAEPAEPAPPSAPEPVSRAEPERRAAPDPAPVREPVREPVRKPEPAAAPVQPRPGVPAAVGSGALPSGLPQGVDWIMQQPDDAYTLQLVTLSSAERAKAFLEAQAEPSRFASFRLQRDGQVLHVVVYGSFPSRVAATTASTDLPAGVGTVKPWIRSFGDVQQAVRTALQQ